ncbi:hypothetical protein HPB50_024543 [Hyalomma asiaticum]|uniref:Uncharacterized protein n=1 Tax=Hyalomma asiaticum TaxID=266040 RepID=A0ACB7SHM4_HYAAI|nr:hypothetical protein HPB50_024543 [Hyalomma asiaticum]
MSLQWLQFARPKPKPPAATNVPDRYSIIIKIEGIVLSLIRQIAKDEPPRFVYDRRQGWENVVYCHRRGLVRKDNPREDSHIFRLGDFDEKIRAHAQGPLQDPLPAA